MLIDFLLRQQCEVSPYLGYRDGADQYGEAEVRACRIQERLQTGNSLGGTAETVTARAMMFCTGEMIPERSRVTCGGKSYIVTACRRARGFGEEHLEVTMQ